MELRSTFAFVDAVEHRLRAVASLLSISENTLRTSLSECGINIRRANSVNTALPAVRIFDLPTIFEIAAWRRNKKLSKGLEGKRPIVMAVEIIKGGVGKTTTACEVAVQLQLQGLRVLAIDIDIQANLSQLFGYESDLEADEASSYNLNQDAIVSGTFATLCAPIAMRSTQRVDARSVMKYPFGPFGPALIPADTYFGDLEKTIEKSAGPRELVFQRFFAESMEGKVPGLNVSDFDIVIFDCPPNVSFVASNAIACADIVIAPVKMESFSVKGLAKLINEFESLYETYPRDIKKPELVILPTHFSISLPRVGRMKENLARYRAITSDTSISQSEEFPKATEKYLPLTLIKPTCQPVKEYRRFVEHLIKLILDVSKAKEQGLSKAGR
jgi:chromosome partitioning protein